MITTVKEKNKTTIIVQRRLIKAEIDRVIKYLNFLEIKPKRTATKKQVQQLANEVNAAAWSKFKKMRGLK